MRDKIMPVNKDLKINYMGSEWVVKRSEGDFKTPQQLLDEGKNFYEMTFKNIGGLVMPLIIRFEYAFIHKLLFNTYQYLCQTFYMIKNCNFVVWKKK